MLTVVFRSVSSMKRIFWSVDHQTDNEILDATKDELARADIALETGNDRRLFIQQYKRAKLQLISESPHLEGYELTPPDQLPNDDMILAAWLVQNQTKAISAPDMAFMDFKAPIEIEALLVPRNLL